MAARRKEARRLRNLRTYLPSPAGDRTQTPDSTLTALLQLVTWRLSKQRAIVSLVDEYHQFFIAESTKTGDLVDPSVYQNEGDHLWMGCTGSTTRNEALCTNTIIAEPVGDGFPSFIVTDLRSDPRFRDLPYVRREPYFRYYAGTPLVSRSGFKIGSLFVIDDRVLPPLNKNEIDFLGIMATNVMNHLEMQREYRLQQRHVIMSKGLVAFVEGRSSISTEPEQAPSSNFTISRVGTPVGSTRSLPLEDALHRRKADAQRSPPGRDPELEVTKDIFERAARILRESLDVDQVLFIDTNTRARANIVGSSCRNNSKTRRRVLSTDCIFDQNFLGTLHRRYPQGVIWTYDEDGTLDCDDGVSPGPSRRSSLAPSDWHNADYSMNEGDELAKCFPESLQIIYSPLWDSDKQFSEPACFVVSARELPIMTTEVELPFVRAFINSVAAVCGRFIAILGEQQKSTFISSISHELRSPLHGILASAELLGETTLNPVQKDLRDTVQLCSETLLDTILQVLDYSKVNKFLRNVQISRGLKEHVGNPSLSTVFDKASETHAGTSLLVESACDVATLCEEALGVATLAFERVSLMTPDLSAQVSFGGSSTTRRSQDPSDRVLVDFTASKDDWVFFCSPGAIRRIIMNLVGNSFKHTQHGSISVNLSLEKPSNASADLDEQDAQTRTATLTVSDTGRGMSRDFLDNKLFVPFSQESSLVAGSGLGLTLVQGIVKSMHGTIDVWSSVDIGTKVEVKVRLNRLPKSVESTAGPPTMALGSEPFGSQDQQRTYRLFGPVVSSRPHLERSLVFYLQEWWGMQQSSSAESSDITFLYETDLAEFKAQTNTTSSLHLAVLLFFTAPVVDVRLFYSSGSFFVEPLTVPFGPQKLFKTLRAGCDRMKEFNPSANPALAEMALSDPQNKLHGNSGNESTSLVHNLAKGPTSVPIRTIPTSNSVSSKSTSVENGLRMLCVDDNHINLKLLCTFVKKLGIHHVETASDGSQAVQITQKSTQGFHVIFMDLTMPVCDGFEATRQIRQLELQRKEEPEPERISRALIIALTGLASESDQKRAFDAGIDHFVTKPLRFKDLKGLLTKWGVITAGTDNHTG